MRKITTYLLTVYGKEGRILLLNPADEQGTLCLLDNRQISALINNLAGVNSE